MFRFRKDPDATPRASEPPVEPELGGLPGAVRYHCECLDCNVEAFGGAATAITFQMRHLICWLRITNLTGFEAEAAELVAETEQFLGVSR